MGLYWGGFNCYRRAFGNEIFSFGGQGVGLIFGGAYMYYRNFMVCEVVSFKFCFVLFFVFHSSCVSGLGVSCLGKYMFNF